MIHLIAAAFIVAIVIVIISYIKESKQEKF